MNIFVGNLNFKTTEEELRQLFSGFGEISSAKIVKDFGTGRSRGFGFVEMDDAGAQTAITQLNDSNFMDQTIVVNEAKPRPQGNSRSGGGGFNRGSGGFNRGGGGYSDKKKY